MNKYERVPEKVIDLHGYTTKEAAQVLDGIIMEGKSRHVRVITGKGAFRETGPVLRSFVKNYLQQRGIRFEVSKLFHGGEGALEMFLE